MFLSIFDPRSSIVDYTFDCHLAGVVHRLSKNIRRRKEQTTFVVTGGLRVNCQIYVVDHFVDFSPHVGTGEYEGKHCRLLLLVCGPMLKVCVEFTFFSLSFLGTSAIKVISYALLLSFFEPSMSLLIFSCS